MTFPDPQLECQLKLSESHETMGARIEQGGGVKGTTRRPIASINHGASQRLKHQAKSMQGLDLAPYTYEADVQLGLCVCPLIIGAEAVSDPVA